MSNLPKKDPLWLIFGIYGAVGIQLALAVIGGWFIGNYFDGRLQTAPWLALIGLIGGFIGGLYNLIRILKWRSRGA